MTTSTNQGEEGMRGGTGDQTGQSDSQQNTNGNTDARQAPEKKLTLFAVRLALLEHASSRLGKFAFLWATVVLLGGFASSIGKRDFWFVAGLLLVGGLRIFSRTQELEWKHHAIVGYGGTRLAGDEKDCNSQRRRWHRSNVPLLPRQWVFFPGRCIPRLFQAFQIAFAVAGGVVSALGLAWWDGKQYDVNCQSTERRNIRYALKIFYSLEIACTIVSVLELTYLAWMFHGRKLIGEVRKECFGNHNDNGADTVALKRFFYVSYSKCIGGGIFDGLDVDLVSFVEELLLSDSHDEHLMGASILRRLTANNDFTEDTLWKIGSNPGTVERLVEMLNWKETPLRTAAAEILSKLVEKKQNAVRVAGIPGSVVSIALLLYTGKEELQQLGLKILNELVRDHDNCDRIGSTRGLIRGVIKLTAHSTNSDVVVESSLRLMSALVSTKGSTGSKLRDKTSTVRETFVNIHRIFCQEGDLDLHKVLAIKVLRHLIIDNKVRDRIPLLQGFIDLLIRMYLQKGNTSSPKMEAAQTLAEVTIKSRDICTAILNSSGSKKFIAELIMEVYSCCDYSNAAKILGKLCSSTYARGSSGAAARYHRLKTVVQLYSPGTSTTLAQSPESTSEQLRAVPDCLNKVVNCASNVVADLLKLDFNNHSEACLLDLLIWFILEIYAFMIPMTNLESIVVPEDILRGICKEVQSSTLVDKLIAILTTKQIIGKTNIKKHAVEFVAWLIVTRTDMIPSFKDKDLLECLEEASDQINSEIEMYGDLFSAYEVDRTMRHVKPMAIDFINLIEDIIRNQAPNNN